MCVHCEIIFLRFLVYHVGTDSWQDMSIENKADHASFMMRGRQQGLVLAFPKDFFL